MSADPVPSDVPSHDNARPDGWISLQSEDDLQAERQRIAEEHLRFEEGTRRAEAEHRSNQLLDITTLGLLCKYLEHIEELKEANRNAGDATTIEKWVINYRLARRWEAIETTPGYRELELFINSKLSQEVNPKAIEEVVRRLAKLRHTTLMDARFLSIETAAAALSETNPPKQNPPKPKKPSRKASVEVPLVLGSTAKTKAKVWTGGTWVEVRLTPQRFAVLKRLLVAYNSEEKTINIKELNNISGGAHDVFRGMREHKDLGLILTPASKPGEGYGIVMPKKSQLTANKHRT